MPNRSSLGRVLIVDDQAADRRYLSRVLAEIPVDVLKAADSHEALEMAAELAPDLLLLDVFLPGEDGFSVCRRLHEDPEIPAIPVIMLSGQADLDDRLRGLRAGATEFLAKPVDAEELCLRVENLLTQRGALREVESALRDPRRNHRLRAEWTAYAVDQLEGRLQGLEVRALAQRRRLAEARRLVAAMVRHPGFALPQGETPSLSLVMCDLSELLEEIGEEAGLTLDCGDLGTVWADRDLLRRLLWQLVAVASDLAGHGGVELRLRVSASKEACRTIELGVSGSGIWHGALDWLARGMVSNGSLPQGGGMELSLSFCRHAVDLMEGAIAVEAIPGKGWAFTLSLPDEDASAPGNIVAFKPRAELAYDKAVNR